MLVQGTLWHHCLRHLESEVPEQQFNTWVRPLQAVERDGELQLLAPNRFVVSWIEKNLFARIEELVGVAGARPAARASRSRSGRAGTRSRSSNPEIRCFPRGKPLNRRL